MIDFEFLAPSPEFELTIELDSGETGIELPLSVPLHVAEHGTPEGVLLWADRAGGLVGFYRSSHRVSWHLDNIAGVNIAVLHPSAERPGVVGLELALAGQAEEEPILATDQYSRSALDWFKEKRALWEAFFGVPVSVRDYGPA